jgi:hypothetical protein
LTPEARLGQCWRQGKAAARDKVEQIREARHGSCARQGKGDARDKARQMLDGR